MDESLASEDVTGFLFGISIVHALSGTAKSVVAVGWRAGSL